MIVQTCHEPFVIGRGNWCVLLENVFEPVEAILLLLSDVGTFIIWGRRCIISEEEILVIFAARDICISEVEP